MKMVILQFIVIGLDINYYGLLQAKSIISCLKSSVLL